MTQRSPTHNTGSDRFVAERHYASGHVFHLPACQILKMVRLDPSGGNNAIFYSRRRQPTLMAPRSVEEDNAAEEHSGQIIGACYSIDLNTVGTQCQISSASPANTHTALFWARNVFQASPTCVASKAGSVSRPGQCK